MADPSWLAGPLAAIMIAVALYCIGRLAAARRWRRPADRDADIAHVAMGVAMAGMLVPRLNPLWDSAWEAGFGAATAWFGGHVLRDARRLGPGGWVRGHYVPHLLHSAAMLYMLLAVSGSRMGSMGAGGSARFPLLAVGLALALVGYAIWDIDRLTALAVAGRLAVAATEPAANAGPQASGGTPGPADPPIPGRVPPAVLAPRLAAACRIILGITMGYMLIVML